MSNVQIEKLMGIVNDCGLTAEPLTSYWKISVGGKAVYVAKTQKVSRVDISGFQLKHPAVRALTPDDAKELRLGKVRGQLDFDKPEGKVLEAFRSALETMKHLAAAQETDAPQATAGRKTRGKQVEVAPAAPPKTRRRKQADVHA